MASREEQELAEYRELMEAPDTFVDGFDWKTVVGALFIGFVMMPGSIYLGLVAGQSMGPAAEWVTIILFTEIARRSFTVLKRQEIYILYYIAGGLVSMMGGVALSGGAFAQLIWNQFMVQAPSAAAFRDQIPQWVAPHPDSPAIAHRTFLHPDWIPAILVLMTGQVLGRLSWFGMGYALFRITSDRERLPFPMAPIAAQGATALAESSAKTETWRWRVFSIGTMIGVAFGTIYVGIPTLSGVLLVKPIAILPIPWIDFTQGTERFLPAAPTGITTNLTDILVGMVLPFWIVAGGFAAAVVTTAANPILYKANILQQWQPGMDTIQTTFANQIDFWLSFTIGSGFAIAFIGGGRVISSYMAARGNVKQAGAGDIPPGRGDIPLWAAIMLYVGSTIGYIALCMYLVPEFPWLFFVFYGFFWTPLTSYVNARMIGLTGQFIGFPMVREATFILSGYKGVAIWFAPIPFANYGGYAQRFREVELTGTKITSMIKAELLMFPIAIFCSLLFWQFVWRLAPIPSVLYPYAQKFWHFQAMQSWLWISATTERQEVFMQALKWKVIVGGLSFGLISYWVLGALRWPVMLVYGFIRGMGTFPHMLIPQMFGALLGRYYFARRFGEKTWRQYTPVLLAGFSCGMGLIGMVAIAVALISQSITQMPF